MGKIYVRTYAYNAEKTIARTIESILAQTHKEFVYYICENGSTDGTREIIKAYEKKDSRIKAFYQEVNGNYAEAMECLMLPYQMEEDDYFCVIDADDEYKPTFLEEMITFMEENNLDIGCCGSEFLDVTNNNELMGERRVDEDMIIEGEGFSNLFTQYHIFARTSWGKIFNGRTIKSTIQDPDSSSVRFPKGYGGDTYNALLAFKAADKVGIYAKCLHKYYLSPKSSSYVLHPGRVEADQILHEATLEYILSYGKPGRVNIDFIYEVYLFAIIDTWKVIEKASNSIEEKIDYVYAMFECKYTKELIASEALNYDSAYGYRIQTIKNNLYDSILAWLLEIRELQDEKIEKYYTVGELLCAAKDYAEGWLHFNKIKIQYLLEQNKKKEAEKVLKELLETLPNDEELLLLDQRSR